MLLVVDSGSPFDTCCATTCGLRGGRTLSQLNDTNAVQKWSFSKCRFSTCMGSKIKGKLVYGDIIV